MYIPGFPLIHLIQMGFSYRVLILDILTMVSKDIVLFRLRILWEVLRGVPPLS